MSEGTRAAPSRHKRLLLVLPLLLVLAVAVNWQSLAKIARGEKSLKSIIYGFTDKPALSITGWRLPPDSGDPQAKVTVEVFLMPGDPCHIETLYLGRALGTLDPARLRVKFVNTMAGSPGAERRDSLKLGCEQGLAINGKTEFRVPDPEQPGKQKTVFLSHDGGGMANDILYVLLDRELKGAYSGKGLPMDAAAFAAHMASEMKRFTALEQAKFEARREAAKTK